MHLRRSLPVRRSTNGGASYNASSSGLTAFYTDAIAADPHNDAIVYASGQAGFAKSIDRGETWSVSTALTPRFLAVDGNSSTVYSIASGLFRRSLDGGNVWQTFTTGLPTGAATFIAVDPQVAGTLYTVVGGAVYKKVGDDPWASRGSGLTGSVSFVAVDPHNSSTLYAGGPAGVFKSVNGGDGWSPVNGGLAGVTALGLAVDPFDSRHLFTWSASAVYESTDGGANWLPFAPPGSGNAVALDAAVRNVIYASGIAGLYRSDDGGRNWLSLQNGLNMSHCVFVVAPRGTTLYTGGANGGVFVFQFGRERAVSH